MEPVKVYPVKRNFLLKTWKRCRSFSGGGGGVLFKSRSWHGQEKKKKMAAAAPEGFFPVCVGPDKLRFAVKTKYINHPLFSMLLEDAETEYGFGNDGPISLPCDVDLFYQVLAEMKVEPHRCASVYVLCSPFNGNRRLGAHGADRMAKGYGSFELLTPSRFIDAN